MPFSVDVQMQKLQPAADTVPAVEDENGKVVDENGKAFDAQSWHTRQLLKQKPPAMPSLPLPLRSYKVLLYAMLLLRCFFIYLFVSCISCFA